MAREIPVVHKMPLDEKKVDEMVAAARARLGRRRKRSGVLILVAVAVVGAGLAGIAWLNWPEAEPPRLVVIATDNVSAQGQAIPIRAWLRAANERDRDALLEGHGLFFLDAALAGPGGERIEGRLRERAVTGDNGEASVPWTPAGATPFSVMVRFPGKRYPSYDVARLFAWPPDNKLLIVEARKALMTAPDATLEKKHVLQIQPAAGATPALHTAKAKGYRIVYLAVAPDRLELYRKLRAWLQRRSPREQDIFPEGPVLGRNTYEENGDAEAATLEIIQSLRSGFTGKIVAIVGQAHDAAPFQKEGIKTYLVGPGEGAGKQVEKIKSWADLGPRLP